MSRTIALWFLAMMLLGFACMWAGDASRNADLWFAPASPGMQSRLLPLVRQADAIEPARISLVRQQQALVAQAARKPAQRSILAEVSDLDAAQEKGNALGARVDALQERAMQIGKRAEAWTEQARSRSDRPDADAAAAVAGYADVLEREIGTNDTNTARNVEDSRSYALKLLRQPAPGDWWHHLWSQRSNIFLVAAFGLFMPLAVLIPLGAFALQVFSAWRIRRVGIPATGWVTAVRQQGMVNYVPRYRLSVQLDTGENTVAYANSNRAFQVGERLALLVDPRHRSRAVLA